MRVFIDESNNTMAPGCQGAAARRQRRNRAVNEGEKRVAKGLQFLLQELTEKQD
jgi:hypothetical protein